MIYVSFATVAPSPTTALPVQYGINVTRLLGSETAFASLQVFRGTFEPPYALDWTMYRVLLDVACDKIALTYQALDNGQTIGFSSGVSRPMEPGLLQRRLFGEVQHRQRRVEALIDPGRTRNVSLKVLSADKSAQATYVLQVMRAPCGYDARYFDTDTGQCTSACK